MHKNPKRRSTAFALAALALLICVSGTIVTAPAHAIEPSGYSHDCNDYCEIIFTAPQCAAIHGYHNSTGSCTNYYNDNSGLIVFGYGFCRQSQEAGPNRPPYDVSLDNNQNGIWLSGHLNCAGNSIAFDISCASSPSDVATGYGNGRGAQCRGTGGQSQEAICIEGGGAQITRCAPKNQGGRCNIEVFLFPVGGH